MAFESHIEAFETIVLLTAANVSDMSVLMTEVLIGQPRVRMGRTAASEETGRLADHLAKVNLNHANATPRRG